MDDPLLHLTPVRRGGRTHLRLDDWRTHVPRLPGRRPYLTVPAPGAVASPKFGSAMCGLDTGRTPNALKDPDDTRDDPDGTHPVCRRCEKELVVALRVLNGLPAHGPLADIPGTTCVRLGGLDITTQMLTSLGLDFAAATATG